MKVKDVKLFHIESIIDDQRDVLNENSINSLIIRVKELFKYAVEKEVIYKSPAQFIKTSKQRDTRKRMLTNQEKELIEKVAFDEKEKCFIYLLRYTGMRRGEILSLSRQDIDLLNKKITVSKTLADNGGRPYVKQSAKTDSGDRTIPILDPLYPVLKDYCDSRIGILFTNGKGKLLGNKLINDMWTKIIDKMQEVNDNKPVSDDITPHIFRHTFASDLYDAGIDIKRAQYILGHKNIKTTLDIYTHFDKTKLKADEMNTYYKQSKESQIKTFNA
jgi:integrase